MSVPRLAILLPPSEGKSPGGGRPPWTPELGRFGDLLAEPRAAVAAALAAAGGGNEKLLGVGGAHLERGRAANSSLVGAPTLPASARYTGVVWAALDLADASPPVRSRARASLVAVSALLGLVALDDRIPDHRLKMGASLPPLGKLSTFWREPLSSAIATWAKGRFVVDLLPLDHRAAWSPTPGLRGVRVQFADRDGARVVGHEAKAAKGRLARHLLQSAGDPTIAMQSWTDPRFTLIVTPLQ